MPHLKYAWLQDTLSELIHHTTEARLFSVGKHLSAALAEVRYADTGRSARSERVQRATVRRSLEECLSILTDLGEHAAAEEVGHAIRLLPNDPDTASVVPFPGRTGNGTHH